MFEDFSIKPVEFISCWKTEKKNRENGSQTSEILTYEAETQTHRPRQVECQTESLLDLLNTSGSLTINLNYDQVALNAFLKTVEPIISKQLKINTAASSLYSGIFKGRDDVSQIAISCEHCLEEKSMTLSDGKNKEVTCISWSSSGGSIAVSYGTNDDLAWNDERSCLCLWNLGRPKLRVDACDQKLELESSVQTISFHPLYAGYLAAGLFSGVSLVWDFAKDEVIYSESTHEDPVTCLVWLEHSNNKYLQLLTGSSDGKLLLWRHRKAKETTAMRLEKKMDILCSNLPRRAGVKGHGPIGITCMAPARNDVGSSIRRDSLLGTGSTLIVGCENGSVLKCNTDSLTSDPITFVYDGHVGPVYSVDWSPFNRHLFLTCSTDQTCRIYHSLQASALREIRPEEAVGGREANCLYSAFWSPTKPTLFFAVGSRGRIEACDVATSRCVAFNDVTGRDGKSCSVNIMQMNYKQPNLLATGSATGFTHVWRIGAQLVEADVVEESKVLEDIANEAMTSE